MTDIFQGGFPRQQISFKQKNDKWRRSVIDWADKNASYANFSPTRKSVRHKKINYDLVNMKLHRSDIDYVLNPYRLKAAFIPEDLQHYPVINPLLNLLRGEASARTFDWHVVVTNPTAISEVEKKKRDEYRQALIALIETQSRSEEEFNTKLSEIEHYFNFEYQDFREKRGEELINHYSKELNFPLLFDNLGFMDALIAGEEIYQCDIIGGEPSIRRIDPLQIRIFRSGHSTRVEDADVIIIEDYMPLGMIYDRWYDVLTKKDREYLETAANSDVTSTDERRAFIAPDDWTAGDALVSSSSFFSGILEDEYAGFSMLPYDSEGNFRVLQVYWKSLRKIKKIKSYDKITGEEQYDLYSESYQPNLAQGEEEEVFWINEAWEGTKIGEQVYVNMRPRPIQYNKISNPSRCHFGIIGSLYSIGMSRPVSFVDTLKPYAYLYDAIHDRLIKLIESNLGKLLSLDFSLVPDGWKIEQWLYFAKVNHIAVKNSFNEGKKGAATGKLAGNFSSQANTIDASTANEIQSNINLLQWCVEQMKYLAGITSQRMGEISARETVGGITRAVEQSSSITQWLFKTHDDVKRRTLECFLETAKIAMHGKNQKFEYITTSGTRDFLTIEGDEFSENDYGIIVDNSDSTTLLNSHIETLAQAALQNHLINFSTAIKLFQSGSLAEKARLIEITEQKLQKENKDMLNQQQQIQQEQFATQQKQAEQLRQDQKEKERLDREVKLEVARINMGKPTNNLNENNEETSNDNSIESIPNGTPKETRQWQANQKLNEWIRQLSLKNSQSPQGTNNIHEPQNNIESP